MSNQAMEAETEQQDMGLGWGETLRQARVAQGMSIEDVAAQLHFDNKLIENIEHEVVDKLPPASFVKGYLRSYARLLEIDYEPIVAAFNQVGGGDEPVITKVVKVKEVSSKDTGPRYATWLVVAVLILSVVIWWWAEVLTPAAVEREQAEAVVKIEPMETPAPELVADPATVVEEAPVPEPVPVVETPALATLVLSFEQESWVEVNDAQGKRLYMDMAKAGQSKRIEGAPPFKLLLGNSPGVTVEFNGEIYDHSRHNNKGIARFTLGE